MSTPLHSPMKMGEGPLTVALRCAQCNQPVASGQPHDCPAKKEEADADNTSAPS